MDMIKSLLTPKKVKISDIASPKPSRAATRALNLAMKRAYQDQNSVSRRASTLRSN